ncbi:MAG: DNA polymerase/3'-5' exonuclease PolX [Chloroflexi bacterium]|nr:DNA polymerase/3'-5' exonuclease PolX [Chloroflexota bacterium]
MIRNQEVAALLNHIAELLEAKGESPYRIGAYHTAAQRISSLPEDILTIWKAHRLEDIPGVGESIAAKIDEYLRTGRLRYLEELEQQVAPGLAALLLVPGLGPHRARTLYRALKVNRVADLAKAARERQIRNLPGFGPKLEANILREVERLEQRTRRLPLGVALPAAEEVAGMLRGHPAVERVDPAGSIRRMRDTIGDIDLLVASQQPHAAIEAFTTLPVVKEVLAKGPTRASILAAGALQIDVRVIPPEVYGAALQYFTGSKEHNIALRELALRKGLTLSEYGLFEAKSERRLASATEEEVYAALGLPWILPELRENRGEIEAAQAGRLPRLVEEGDLRGDLHVHTNWSDGADTLEVMAETARRRGYDYVVITDHSRGLGIARGLTVERIREQRQQIDALNRRLAPFRLLHGIEVNIRRDGRLDYPDDVLRQFDLVTVSVHSAFDQPEAAMTERIVRACRHPLVDVLNHPRGRLLGRREGYAVDLEAVLQAARDAGTVVEINSQPDRLDLDDLWARRAKELGVVLAIDTDAHAADHLALIRFGVAVARRAWLAPEHVLNTLPLPQLLARLARRRAIAPAA